MHTRPLAKLFAKSTSLSNLRLKGCFLVRFFLSLFCCSVVNAEFIIATGRKRQCECWILFACAKIGIKLQKRVKHFCFTIERNDGNITSKGFILQRSNFNPTKQIFQVNFCQFRRDKCSSWCQLRTSKIHAQMTNDFLANTRKMLVPFLGVLLK